MNIAQVNKLGGRAANLLAMILEQAPIFRHAAFRLDPSTYFHNANTSTFTGTSARQENAAAQRDAQSPNLTPANLALYSREVSIDDVRKLDKNVGTSPQGLKLLEDRSLASVTNKLALEIQDDMLKGTAADNQMLGMGTLVKDADAAGQTSRLGYSTAQLAAMNKRASLQLNTESTQDQFIEMLEEEIGNVPGANAIIVNTMLGSRLSTIAKRHSALVNGTDQFGKPQTVINDVPIVRVPTTAIPQTESDGTNNDCTSLYIVRFAEELGVAFSTNSGFYFEDFPATETKPQGLARMQFFLNLTVESQNALRRISRIRR